MQHFSLATVDTREFLKASVRRSMDHVVSLAVRRTLTPSSESLSVWNTSTFVFWNQTLLLDS